MRKLFTRKNIRAVMFCIFISISGNLFAAGDMGVQNILSPTDPVCRGNATVTAIIHNFGGLTINSVSVNWRVNGISQTPYSYTGTIGAGNEDTVTLGNFNFASGANTIIAWTSNPNGSADTDDSNDSTTAVINVSTELTGTYTVAGTSPDYPNVTAAVNALIANGVCGPVVFNIRPGTDTMQCVIPEINGVDANNTITFQSESGDSSSVILTYPSLVTIPNNHLFSLDGADYITFNKLTLQRTGNQANAHIIEFTNNATHNTVTHCRLISVVTTLPNSLAALMYSSGGTVFNDSMNTFSNNLFKEGSIGIYMNGVNTLSLEYGTVISDNVFTDQYSKGIQMSNQGNALIDGNSFTTTTAYAGFAAIYLDRSQRPHHITKNKILGVPGSGMYLVDCTAQSGVHGVIANNFIHANDSAGISMVNGDYQDVVNNSILMTGTTSTFAALIMRGSGVGKTVRNNILANTGGGYSYVVSDSAVFGITISDYNNLYKTGPFIGNYNGTNRSTLANWVSSSQKDSNSVSVNPNFVSNSDLHVTSIAMDDLGTHVNSVTDDIDGQNRSALTPDIGADEYSSISRNIGVTGIISPVDGDCGNATTAVRVIISNTGGFIENNFNVRAVITGTLSTILNFNHTANISPGTSDTITFSPTINTAGGGTYHFVIYTQLAADDVRANDTLDIVIHLSPPPAAPNASNSSICGPGIDTLTATSSDTIKWYSASSGGTLLATGSPFITPFLNATTTYYVAAKSACEGPRQAVTVTVFPVPNVNLGNDTSITQGNSVTLNAGTFPSYLWSTGATTATINVNSGGCYWVRVTNASGCQDRDTVCVNIIVPVDVGVTHLYHPSNHDCSDDSIQVMLTVTNLGTDTAFTVPVVFHVTGAVTATLNDTITNMMLPGDSAQLVMGYINVSSGGIIHISAYTSYNGDLTHSNDTLTVHDTIILAPNPPTAFGGSRCGPGTITLNGSVPNDSVYWYDAPSGGNLLHIGNTYNIPGLGVTTTFYAQSGQHCNNPVRRVVTATVHPLPNVNLGNDTSITDSLILDAGPGFVSYQWNNFATSPSITIHNSGIYSVCVVDSNQCVNCDTINVISVGIQQLIADGQINLYPNPAHSSVTIEMNKNVNGVVLMTLSDVQGQIILNEEIKNVIAGYKQTLNVSTYAKGVYYLRVQSEAGVSAYRLIVE